MLDTETPDLGIRRSDHVGVVVASLDEGIRFFVEGLGARLTSTGDRRGEFVGQVTGAVGAEIRIALVDLAGQTIELLEYRDAPRPAGPPSAPFDPGTLHLALQVDDLDALVTRVAAFGWTPRGTPQPIPSGPRAGTRVIYVTGPDGATIEFVEPPRRP